MHHSTHRIVHGIYHGLCCTSCGALVETQNCLMDPPEKKGEGRRGEEMYRRQGHYVLFNVTLNTLDK